MPSTRGALMVSIQTLTSGPGRLSWGKLRAAAGLPSAQFYQLRHTSITAGAEENVPLAVMKALAGHMDERMTDYYASVRDNPKAKAVAAIEKANLELLQILGLGEGPRIIN